MLPCTHPGNRIWCCCFIEQNCQHLHVTGTNLSLLASANFEANFRHQMIQSVPSVV